MFVPSAPPRTPAALTPAATVPTISGFVAVPNRRYDFGFHLSFNRRDNLNFRRSRHRDFISHLRTVPHRRGERLSARHGLVAPSVHRFERRHRCESALQRDAAPQLEVALQPPRRSKRCFRLSVANGANPPASVHLRRTDHCASPSARMLDSLPQRNTYSHK